MPEKPIILDHELVAESRLFGIERVQLRFSNGEERVFERLRTPRIPAVLVVALKDNGNVLLIREYCCGTHDYQLSLPKGAMDRPHETLFEAADRELMEEAGHGARRYQELKPLSLSPGYMGHMIHIVLAEDLYEKRLPGDEPEPLEVLEHPLEDIDTLIAAEDFTEARSLAALYMARDIIRNRK
jgi:ADP-ribose diphosphatase